MFTLRRKMAALAVGVTLIGGGAATVATTAASADSVHFHVNNVRQCNNYCVFGFFPY